MTGIFVLYLRSTGKIMQVVSGPVDTMEAYETEEIGTIEGDGYPGTHYIEISDVPPSIRTMPPRPSELHVFDFLSHTWGISIDAARSARAKSIDASCASQILSGFSSSALGDVHHYPAKSTDQQNLSASVLASLLPDTNAEWVTPFWCSDNSGIWGFKPHTAAQIQQVGRDAKAAILAAMGKNEVLQAQIEAAGSVEELEAIAFGQ